MGGGGGGKGPSEEEQAASETSFKWSRRWGCLGASVYGSVCLQSNASQYTVARATLHAVWRLIAEALSDADGWEEWIQQNDPEERPGRGEGSRGGVGSKVKHDNRLTSKGTRKVVRLAGRTKKYGRKMGRMEYDGWIWICYVSSIAGELDTMGVEGISGRLGAEEEEIPDGNDTRAFRLSPALSRQPGMEKGGVLFTMRVSR